MKINEIYADPEENEDDLEEDADEMNKEADDYREGSLNGIFHYSGWG